jgi:SAM-dependent methyltransferase
LSGSRCSQRERRIESAIGYDPVRFIPVDALGLTGDNVDIAVQYEEVRSDLLYKIINRLPEHAGFSFVDIGSGKGRGLCVASLFAFRKVIGVELSAGLHRIAQENLSRMAASGLMRCKDATSLNGDFADFYLPDSDCVIYLWNPFGQRLMLSFAEKVRACIGKGNRVYVIYLNPVHERALSGVECLEAMQRSAVADFIYRRIFEVEVATYRSREKGLAGVRRTRPFKGWWAHQGSNLGPADYLPLRLSPPRRFVVWTIPSP